MESFEHVQNFPPDRTDINGHHRTRNRFTGLETDIKRIRTDTNEFKEFLSVTHPLDRCDRNLKIEDHLFQGQLPNRLVFCLLVTNEEFNGRYTSNSFTFRHFRLSKLGVSCNGRYIYGRPFEPNFTDDHYLRSCMSLHHYIKFRTVTLAFKTTKMDTASGDGI